MGREKDIKGGLQRREKKVDREKNAKNINKENINKKIKTKNDKSQIGRAVAIAM